MDYVVAFGAPRDVVGVAESIHLQRADVRRKKSKILSGRGEHVPRVEVEERHEEVDADCGASGDNQIGKDVVAKVERGFWVFQLQDHDVDRCEYCVCHDYGIADKAAHEHLLSSGNCQYL